MNKTILVTGCAGFIGWQVTKKLCNKGFSVVGVDNLNDYYDVSLKEWRLADLGKETNLKCVRGDIEDKNFLDGLFLENNFDAVINLAARAGVGASLINPHIYATTNVIGTLNILELCKKYNVEKFVLASTSSLYAGKEMPFSESLATTTPISPYAATKGGAEALAYSYHYLYGLDVSVVRYFTVYGPAGRPDMSIFRFVKWILEGTPLTVTGDGTQSRDFTYVEDIAEGTIKALKKVSFEVINLGGNSPHSLNEVISMIEELCDKKATIENKPFPKEDIKATWAEIGKANSVLGWEPTVLLREGLDRTVKWALENRELIKSMKV